MPADYQLPDTYFRRHIFAIDIAIFTPLLPDAAFSKPPLLHTLPHAAFIAPMLREPIFAIIALASHYADTPIFITPMPFFAPLRFRQPGASRLRRRRYSPAPFH